MRNYFLLLKKNFHVAQIELFDIKISYLFVMVRCRGYKLFQFPYFHTFKELWGIWGVFDQTISTYFGPCFQLFNHYFYKKLSLYTKY